MITYKLDAQVIVHDGFQFVGLGRNNKLFRITEDGLSPIVMRGGVRQAVLQDHLPMCTDSNGRDHLPMCTDGNGRVQFVTDVRKRRCLFVVGGEAHRVHMRKGEFEDSIRIHRFVCNCSNYPYGHYVYVGPNHVAFIMRYGFGVLDNYLKMFFVDAEDQRFTEGDLVVINRRSGGLRIFKFDFASHYYGACVAADGLTAVIYGHSGTNEQMIYVVDLG